MIGFLCRPEPFVGKKWAGFDRNVWLILPRVSEWHETRSCQRCGPIADRSARRLRRLLRSGLGGAGPRGGRPGPQGVRHRSRRQAGRRGPAHGRQQTFCRRHRQNTTLRLREGTFPIPSPILFPGSLTLSRSALKPQIDQQTSVLIIFSVPLTDTIVEKWRTPKKIRPEKLEKKT